MGSVQRTNRRLAGLMVVATLLFLGCGESAAGALNCPVACSVGQTCVAGVCMSNDAGAPLFDGVAQVEPTGEADANSGSSGVRGDTDRREPREDVRAVVGPAEVDSASHRSQDVGQVGGGLTIESIQGGQQSTSCAWPKTQSIKGNASVVLDDVVATVTASGIGKNGTFMVRSRSPASAEGKYGAIRVIVLGVVPVILAGNILRLTGTVTEYYCETQLVIQGTGGIEALGHEAPPQPYPVTAAQISQELGSSEPFEGVYVRLEQVEVANPNVLGSDGKNHGQFTVSAKTSATPHLVQVGWGPKTTHTSQDAKTGQTYSKFKKGQAFNSITGHLYYYFGTYVLRPFSDADLVLQ